MASPLPQGRSPQSHLNQCDRAWIEIDILALKHNVRQVKSILAPQAQLMAVVKADAYGHGATQVATAALEAGATWLATATIQEGIELRQAEITAPVLILGALNTSSEIQAAVNWQLQPTITDIGQAQQFNRVLSSVPKTLPVHLNIDTGMSRLGTAWNQANPLIDTVQQLPGLKIASIYSHLATADDPNPEIMRLQHRRFLQMLSTLNYAPDALPALHLANCAAAMRDRSLHYNFVRAGLALYGLYPAPDLKSVVDLQPVLQLKARITQIKTIPAGTGVSYGYQFVTKQDSTIAVVGIGYADGVPRNLSNRLRVLIRGQWVNQIGAITMDQLILDVSHLDCLQVGEVVTLIGRDGDLAISADDWAEALNTISWEILCGFKHRLPRVYRS